MSDYYEAEKVMRENQHTVVVGSAMGTGSVKNATTEEDGRQCGTVTYNQHRGVYEGGLTNILLGWWQREFQRENIKEEGWDTAAR